MKIQILGSGCDKCKKLAANVKLAVERFNLSCEIEKIEDINQIIEFGVMMTPALVVNGKVVSSGKVLTVDEITDFLAIPSCDCGRQCSSLKAEKAEPSCCCRTPAKSYSYCGDDSLEIKTSYCDKSASDTDSCCYSSNGKKKIMTIVLLFFVAASIVFMLFKQFKGAFSAVPSAGTEQSMLAIPQEGGALTVYYFHGNQRCVTCNKIEQLTKQAIEEKYSEELASGKIVFRTVNVEDVENEHFIKDFELTVRSVVMEGNGRFEVFDSAWDLVSEPEKFQSYIQDGVKGMLEESLDE